jgi:regulator of sigma E protease
MFNTLVAILIIGLLILVHELGHFFVARWSGVRILCLSIGFGPKLMTWKRGQTEYALSAIPLGGYVKMAGEQEQERSRQPWEYLSQSIAARSRIIAAGPLMNYLTAVVALWVAFVAGYPELLPVVGGLSEGMPAQRAGLQIGDRIRAIDGESIETWDKMTELVSGAPGQVLTVTVERAGSAQTLPVTPALEKETDPFGRERSVGRIGITPSGDFVTIRLGPIESMMRTMTQHAEWLGQTLLGLWSMLTGRIPVRDSVTGPIGIIYLTSEAVRLGLGPLLYFVSIISLMLAFFNLFPIPVLDGGHLFFLALERLRGRPVSFKVQERAAQVSFALLMAFILFVCVNDVSRFWFGKEQTETELQERRFSPDD